MKALMSCLLSRVGFDGRIGMICALGSGERDQVGIDDFREVQVGGIGILERWRMRWAHWTILGTDVYESLGLVELGIGRVMD
jgi:hypothetical protein